MRAPHDVLWKPAVVATEWGHVLAPLALLLAFPGRRPDAAGWVSLVAGIVLLTPWMRAIPVARALDAELAAALDLPPGPLARIGIPGLGGIRTRVEPRRIAIPAADGTELPADLYAGRPGAPLIVAIHGGSWSAGDPTQLPEMYHRLAARGYHVAAITYRLVPAHRHPAQADDVAAAVSWLEAHAADFGWDAARVVLYGRSAGGHLALLQATAVQDPAVVGVLALYPVTDFDWSWDHPTNPLVVDSFATITDLLGRRREDDPDRATYHAASPYYRVRPGLPPIVVGHGGRDELVFHEQSERFVGRLRDAGDRAYLLSLPWATHGFEANLDGPSGRLWCHAVDRALAKWAPLP